VFSEKEYDLLLMRFQKIRDIDEKVLDDQLGKSDQITDF